MTWKRLIRRYLLNNFLARYFLLYPLFWMGYVWFSWTGRTPWISFFSFRQLYAQTLGRLNRRMAARLARQHPPVPLPEAQGLLGAGSQLSAAVDRTIAVLQTEGYHVLPAQLPAAVCEEIVAFARSTPADPYPQPPGHSGKALFDPQHPLAPWYKFDEVELVKNAVVRKIITDPTLLLIAQRYFQAEPIHVTTSLWWSSPVGGKASSEVAQLYHFDLDRFQWLIFFFYLTDVTSECGPHAYVKGTHKQKPEEFFEDRRFSDEEVRASFKTEDIREILGPAGTIIAADTMCLHKGTAPLTGYRLMMECIFTTSLFGQTYERPEVDEDMKELLQAQANCPRVYQRFQTRSSAALCSK